MRIPSADSMRILKHSLHYATVILLVATTAPMHPAGAHDGDDQRPLTHEDYDRWNTISGVQISNDGKWIMYVVENGKQERTLFVRETSSSREYMIQRGKASRFSFDSKFAAYRIGVDEELVKKLKREDTDETELPKEQFEILEMSSGKHWTVDGVKSFAMPKEHGDWIAFLLDEPPEEKTVKEDASEITERYEVTPEGLRRQSPGTSKAAETEPTVEPSVESPEAKQSKHRHPRKRFGKKKKIEKEGQDEDEDEQKKEAGTTLVLRNLRTGVERRIPHVVRYEFGQQGKRLAIATSVDDDPAKDGVHVVDLQRHDQQQVMSGLGNYKDLTFSDDETRLAFISDREDYESEHRSWSLYLWRARQKKADKIASEGTKGIPDGWWVPESTSVFFAENGKRLFFSTAPMPTEAQQEDEDAQKDEQDECEEQDEDLEEEEEETANLDIWHWKEPLIQPQQLLEAEQERKRSYRAVYHLRTKQIRQLATEEVHDVRIDAKSDADIAIGFSEKKYQRFLSWDFPMPRDVYLVDIKTGARRLVLEKIRPAATLSPSGEFLLWWDTKTRHWMARATQSELGGEQHCISTGIEHPLYDELHDTPSDPPPYGVAGWMDDDRAVLVYDRYDIWRLDPTGNRSPICLTTTYGRSNKRRLRYRQLDPEHRSFQPEESIYLTVFDETTKASGFYRFDFPQDDSVAKADDAVTVEDGKVEEVVVEDPATPPRVPVGLTRLLMLDESLGQLRKARDSDAVIFTRSTFERFPDLWLSTTDFESVIRLSRANPQQHEYTWGTAALTQWKATDGQTLDGLLYRPDDFDAQKKYPLLVYFYERRSDNLHTYYTPAAGRSIINISFYVSRGYVVFVPDIPYTTGSPGPSASNSVLPGVQHLVDQGFVDERRIGVQGHSWGGYQAAYLITQTDLFACAEAGAPVSNMTSAYGGIRWGTGLSRMFQYERSQSRIGASLWKARDQYIANSPLFFADKINTPVLILHNDEDGAVPWYQGIELFMALRRLEKPAWLLNYNENPHWVMGEPNRRDFARRMQQFFDHYLLDDPLPVWMAKGIPAVDKGDEFGFEPFEEAGEETTR